MVYRRDCGVKQSVGCAGESSVVGLGLLYPNLCGLGFSRNHVVRRVVESSLDEGLGLGLVIDGYLYNCD